MRGVLRERQAKVFAGSKLEAERDPLNQVKQHKIPLDSSVHYVSGGDRIRILGSLLAKTHKSDFETNKDSIVWRSRHEKKKAQPLRIAPLPSTLG